MSRYLHPCPVCGAVVPPTSFNWKPSFPCPACGEELGYDSPYMPAIWLGSFLGGPFFAWRFGYRGLVFVFVAVCITLPLLFSGIAIYGLVFPPGFKRYKQPNRYSFKGGASFRRKPFDRVTSLHLTDKTDADKKTGP